MVGATMDVAAWVAGVTQAAVPDAARAAARGAVLDTIGATLAGAVEPVARIVAGIVAEDGARGVASQLGGPLRTSAEGAALVNGTSGHALDYDDVSSSMHGHPSVVVLPAALAVAEVTGASGQALLDAYLVGVEVAAKLGRAMGPGHYRAGWHATATLGTLAAAMAAGKLLGLDADRLAHALAIAVSEASGSRRNFGTMTKPFHPGHAASCGILAARLAARGMTGDITALEAPLGFFALFGQGEGRPEAVAESLGRPWDALSPGISTKKYPCCFATHRAADGLLDLAAETGAGAEDVAAVDVVVPVGGLAPLIHDRPHTGLEGKFSMQYVLSAALVDRGLGLDTFTEAAIQRSAVQRLLGVVRAREDPAIPVSFNGIEEGYVDVRLRLRDGHSLERRVMHPRGSPQAPLRTEEQAVKFRDCARRSLPPEKVEAALAQLQALEDARDVHDLVACLVPA